MMSSESVDDDDDDDDDDGGSDDGEMNISTDDAAANNPLSSTGLHILDVTELAIFDSLLSPATSEPKTPVAMSNFELLSHVNLTSTNMVEVSETGDEDKLQPEDAVVEDRDDGMVYSSQSVDFASSGPSPDMSRSDTFISSHQSGSMIESGKGDLLMSPVRSSMSNISLPRIPSLLRTGNSFAKVKNLLPWKNSASAGSPSDGQTEYIIDAAELISQAQEYEMTGNYQIAFGKYKEGIGILLKGVQSKLTFCYINIPAVCGFKICLHCP